MSGGSLTEEQKEEEVETVKDTKSAQQQYGGIPEEPRVLRE